MHANTSWYSVLCFYCVSFVLRWLRCSIACGLVSFFVVLDCDVTTVLFILMLLCSFASHRFFDTSCCEHSYSHASRLPSQAASCIFAVFAQRDCSGSSWGGDSDNRIPSYEDCVVSDSMLVARFTRFPPRASILSASLSFFAFPSACASLWRLPTCCAGHDCRKIYKTSSSCLYSFSFIVVLRFG